MKSWMEVPNIENTEILAGGRHLSVKGTPGEGEPSKLLDFEFNRLGSSQKRAIIARRSYYS